jgi:branched-chain amino acid transport system substrate-binding protein
LFTATVDARHRVASLRVEIVFISFRGIDMATQSFRLATIGVSLLLSACAGSGSTSKQPQASSNEIVLGVAGPMTGDLAAFGEQLRRGAEQAVEDLNAEGGVLGKRVRLVIGDDQCDPRRAVRVANDLVDQGVVFVDGHFCSGSTIPASEVYRENRTVLQITPSSTNPMVTERGIKTLLRTTGRDDMQGGFAGAWLAENYRGKNIGLIDDKSKYGAQLADETEKALEAAGIKAAIRDTYNQRQKDFSALIGKLRQAEIDAVYVGGYHDDVALLVRQAREQGFMGAFAGADALNTSEFWSIAGQAANGMRYSDASSQVNLVSAKATVEKFRADGYEPEGYTLGSYAAVQAWAAAAEIAGTTEATKVAEALHGGTIPTVIGDLSWDDKGDLTYVSYAWYVWDNGRAIEEP